MCTEITGCFKVMMNGAGRKRGAQVKTYKGLVSVNVIGPAVSAKLTNFEVRTLSSHRDWETEALPFLMVPFQRSSFQALENDTPELQKTHIHSEEERKDSQLQALYNKCSKKERLGAYLQVFSGTNRKFSW